MKNAAVGVKDNAVLKAKTVGVSTRSRAALCDIKNKTANILPKDVGKQKPLKNEQCLEQKKEVLEMSIDSPTPDVTTQKPTDQLKEFQASRKLIRLESLASEIAEEYLDVDRNDYEDAATVYPYTERIFNYLQDRELLIQPLKADYMDLNCEITPRMRYILVNWLVQVHYSYKLQPETLYLCVAILDRYLLADRTMHNLAKYFLELTIQEYDLAHLPGNLRSVTALCLSRALCLGTSELEKAWCDKLSYLSGYRLSDIRDYLQILARAAYRQNSPSKYRAIFNKYRVDDFYGRVASLPQLRSYLMETLADLKFDSDGEANSA
ncbi:unnamed protein product [Schistosoma turkestanicum]|nr:unnamed protein product [Schistosoma turkestanicum]